MENYKLDDVKWFFYKKNNFGEPEYHLIPYVENKNDCNEIILIQGKRPCFKDIEKHYIDYRVNMGDYSQTAVLRSASLYSIYLLSKPKFLLNAFEKKFVGTVDDETYVKMSLLKSYLKAMVYSEKEVLALGKRFKKAYVKYLKQQEKINSCEDDKEV